MSAPKKKSVFDTVEKENGGLLKMSLFLQTKTDPRGDTSPENRWKSPNGFRSG